MVSATINKLHFIAKALVLIHLCSSCTQQTIHTLPAQTKETACLAWYAAIDTHLEKNRLFDPATAKIDGFPYLRADRFLATFPYHALSKAEFAAWLIRLGRLDRDIRLIETANLPFHIRRDIIAEAPVQGALAENLEYCSSLLTQSALEQTNTQRLLTERVQSIKVYRRWQRWLGGYGLAQFPAQQALKNLHRQLGKSFLQYLSELPVEGKLIRYAPADTEIQDEGTLSTLLRRSYRSPLAIPELTDRELQALFDRHAPVWEIDTRNANDKFGTATINAQGKPEVDTAQAIVYRKLAYARWQNQIVPQLIYQIWFPAREKTGAFDWYGGSFDSVIWRVTLNPKGTPIAYDSVHACGCYYLLFPGLDSRRIEPRDGAEAVLSPKALRPPKFGERFLLRLASRTHYLLQIGYANSADTVEATYRALPYEVLLSLKRPDGSRRSFFDPNGFVDGSVRAERFFLWPFGIPSPGAMRQWGLHAIAFTGERYFDDPFLLEQLLAPVS